MKARHVFEGAKGEVETAARRDGGGGRAQADAKVEVKWHLHLVHRGLPVRGLGH